MSDKVACENTDRELWRGPDEGCGDYYADSIFITKEGSIGINCGGSVYVKPLREWHRLAGGPIIGQPKPQTYEGPDDGIRRSEYYEPAVSNGER